MKHDQNYHNIIPILIPMKSPIYVQIKECDPIMLTPIGAIESLIWCLKGQLKIYILVILYEFGNKLIKNKKSISRVNFARTSFILLKLQIA